MLLNTTLTFPIRLQAYLAKLGYGSRRQIENLIAQGKVYIDGKPAIIGHKITAEQHAQSEIKIDGKMISAKNHFMPQWLMYNKPAGVWCTHRDKFATKTVFDDLPAPDHGKWLFVGRLDVATRGLVLLTNDGQAAQQLSHPSFQQVRVYEVYLDRPVQLEMLTHMRRGVMLEDGWIKPSSLKAMSLGNDLPYLEITVKEGRNRLVRRFFSHFGYTVVDLVRIQFGPFLLPESLAEGCYQAVSPDSISMR